MELILALIYFLKEILSANLDLFYFLMIALLIYNKQNNIYILKKSLLYIALFIVWLFIQINVFDYLNTFRAFINLSKIFICILLLLYTKYNFYKLNICKFLNYICKIFIIALIISLIFKNNIFWRLNDTINLYNKVRLKMFYFEPSELGFQVGLILIFIIQFIKSKKLKNKITNLIYLICLSIILFLSHSLGAILSLSISIIYFFTFNYLKKTNVKKILKFYSFVFILICIITFTIISKSSTYLRVLAILNNSDGSVLYRFDYGYKIMKAALLNSHFLGIGFGNLNTEYSLSIYSSYGLVKVISNSFMYFISEGGIFAIIFLVIFNFTTLKTSLKQKSVFKTSLFIYIFIYQIAGGYFTNPLNWIIYGIINSNDNYISN